MRAAALKIGSILVMLPALVLGGCSEPITLAAAGVSMGSLVYTKKTVADHAVSLVTQEDCSIVQLEREGYYCRPKPQKVAIVEPTLYCYRTLAQVTCYTKPDPHGNKDTLVGIRPGDTPE